MRQLIIGKDVNNATATGVKFINEAGVVLTAAPASGKFRVELNGSNVKSPWIDVANVVSANTATGAAAAAEVFTVTLVEDAAATEPATVKFIDTSAGYEPFARKSYEVACNGAAGTFAANVAAAITADIAAGNSPFITAATAAVGVLTITGTVYAGGNVDASNIQMAYDANGSAATVSAQTFTTTAFKGTGDVFVIADLEKNLLGSGVSDYDRATYLPDPSDIYADVTGFPYQLNVITWKNDAPGQIRGVDNVRELIIAVENSAAAVAPATSVDSAVIVAAL